MITIESVNLKNVVTYKDQTFDFQPGLTVVKGENRAGKSLLFSSLSNLLYFSHPLADKKDAKSILTGRDKEAGTKTSKAEEASITLNVTRGTQKYSIKQKASKESIVYQIQENDIDLDSRTIALSKTLIEGIFPQPEDIFFTSTYLTSYRNHPLLHGSTAQRYEFFEKLFNFDFFDYLYDKFNLELKELEGKKIELSTLESHLLELPHKQEELTKASAELDAVQVRREAIQANLSALTQLRLEVIRLLDMQGDLAKAQNALKMLGGTTQDEWVLLSSLDATIEDLEKNYALQIESEKNNKLLQAKKEEVTSAQSKLLEISNQVQAKRTAVLEILINLNLSVEEASDQTLQELLSSNQREITKAQSILQGKTFDQWKNVYEKSVELEQLTATTLNLTLAEVKALTEEACASAISKLQEEQASLKFSIGDTNTKLSKISSLAQHKADASHDKINCPTCLSELSAEQVLKYKEELTTTLEQATNKLTDTEALLLAYNRYQKCLSFMKAAPLLEEIEKATHSISFLSNQAKIIQEAVQRFRTYTESNSLVTHQTNTLESLQKQLHEVSASSLDAAFLTGDSESTRKEIETKKSLKKAIVDLGAVQKKVTTKIQEVEALIQTSDLLKNIPTIALTTDNLSDLLPKVKGYLEGQISLNTTENVSLQSSITNNSVAVAMLRKELVQLEQFKTKVTKLRADLEQYDTINKLAKVFHAKGFRLEKIKYFTQVFETTLNRYAGFLFMEPFSFSIVVEKRDLQIIATRAGKQSDVRYLSGSESRCFQLLCLISILSLLPSSKKANICVLDEMDAGCDESTTQMFYESFLPELRSIVPSIIVITPLKDNGFYINEDRSYMIKKIHGVSTAVELNK